LRGQVQLDGTRLDTGDGAALSNEETVTLTNDASSGARTELLFFDLA
jgi:hypothetical protein